MGVSQRVFVAITDTGHAVNNCLRRRLLWVSVYGCTSAIVLEPVLSSASTLPNSSSATSDRRRSIASQVDRQLMGEVRLSLICADELIVYSRRTAPSIIITGCLYSERVAMIASLIIALTGVDGPSAEDSPAFSCPRCYVGSTPTVSNQVNLTSLLKLCSGRGSTLLPSFSFYAVRD